MELTKKQLIMLIEAASAYERLDQDLCEMFDFPGIGNTKYRQLDNLVDVLYQLFYEGDTNKKGHVNGMNNLIQILLEEKRGEEKLIVLSKTS